VVSQEGSQILITPPTPETVYVPVYEPAVVYGDWPWPLFPPFYFPGFFDGYIAGGFGFGWFGFPVVGPLWGWGLCDWGHHWIDIDRGRWTALNRNYPPPGGGAWQHDPYHRRGVPYRNAAIQSRFPGAQRPPEMSRAFRGYPTGTQQLHSGSGYGRPSAERPSTVPQGPRIPGQPNAVRSPAVIRPAAPQTYRAAPQAYRPAQQAYRASPAPRMPPSFESFGRGADVRSQAERGYSSRMSMPAIHSGGGAAPAVNRGPHR
jgi:hypothetical protein